MNSWVISTQPVLVFLLHALFKVFAVIGNNYSFPVSG